MSELKDWRGTPIEVGSVVFYHGNSSWSVGIGTVTSAEGYNLGAYQYGEIRVDWHEHKGHKNKKSQPLLPENVTVLTEELMELIPR